MVFEGAITPKKVHIMCNVIDRDNVQKTKQMCLMLKQGVTIYIHDSNVEKHVIKLSLDWLIGHINNCCRRLSKILWFVSGEQINYLLKLKTEENNIDLWDTDKSQYILKQLSLTMVKTFHH